MPVENRTHSFAVITALATVLLLSAGALVTGTGSGLAVPDWPLSYGRMMPPMIGGVFYEHGHRMVAGSVLILTVGLGIYVLFSESRKSIRRLVLAAVIAVFAQAVLGGLTVLLRLPKAVSIAHAFLAQTFFVLMSLVVLLSSASWEQVKPLHFETATTVKKLAPWIFLMNALFFVQLILGATMRHFGAGLAIPDFPTVFGGFFPAEGDFGVWIHFFHRANAYLLVLFVAFVVAVTLTYLWNQTELVFLVGGLTLAVSVQVLFGAMVIWLKRPVWLTTAHLVTGAVCLAMATCLNVWVQRLRRMEPLPRELAFG